MYKNKFFFEIPPTFTKHMDPTRSNDPFLAVVAPYEVFSAHIRIMPMTQSYLIAWRMTW